MSERVNMDETGWRSQGERRALWGIFDRPTRLLLPSPPIATRITPSGCSLITEAIVTSDRWWAYAHLPLHRRQLCWSHLKRDFAAHAEGLAAEKDFGEVGLSSQSASSGPGRSSSTPQIAVS